MARKKSQPVKGRAHPEDAVARRKNIAKHKKKQIAQRRKVGTSLRDMTMSTEALKKHLKVKRPPNNNLSTRGASMDDGYRGWLNDGLNIHDIRGFHIDNPISNRDPVEIANMDDFINFSRHPQYIRFR
eukprot:SAG22_NODE_2169_length_2894_cov_416.669410_2_plen_128_part_00